MGIESFSGVPYGKTLRNIQISAQRPIKLIDAHETLEQPILAPA
jgi:hypothetical protein